MSETQAIKTIDDVEIDDGEQVKPVVTEEPEAIEIEIEGGAKPAPRGKSRFEKRLSKKNDQNAALQAQINAKDEELKLFRMAQSQTESLTEPDEDSFDNDAEYKVAKKAYNKQIIEEIAGTKAQELFKAAQQQTTQVNQTQQQEASFSEHYRRADAMNIKNFDELEGNAVEILGKDFVQGLIAKTDNSHEIIASIGANPGKAAEIAEIAKTDVVKAFLKAATFKINPNLNVSLKQTPDPDTSLSPGEPTGEQSDKKLEALRAKAAVSGDLKELIAYKRSLKAGN